MWWIHLLVLGALSTFILAAQDCNNKVTCSDCIQTPSCMWCSNPRNIKDGDIDLVRCQQRWGAGVWRWKDLCDGDGYIERPENYFALLRNKEFSPEETIVQPQRVVMKLRVQEAQSMQLTYHQINDHTTLQGTFTKVEMNDNATKSVNIRYFSKCGGTVEKETSLCEGLTVGDTIEFRIEIKVVKCPASRDERSQIIKVNPVGLPDNLIIDLKMACACNCDNPGHPEYKVNANACHGLGNFVCGVCICDERFFGDHCECGYLPGGKSNFVFNISSCRQPGHQSICSDRGTCSCGECRCEQRQNYDERVDGRYCQCTNFLCERNVYDILCSGPDHGTCVCNECQCKPGWTGPACSCEDSDEGCMNPDSGLECSGQGKCECNVCKCYETGYQGKWCENCPTCNEKCVAYKPCVECQAFQTGELTPEECETNCIRKIDGKLVRTAEVEEEGERLCSFFDENDCRFNFVYGFVYGYEEPKVRVQRRMNNECPPKKDLGDREVSIPQPTSPTLNLNHTITFTTRASMFLDFHQCTLGTLAYVIDDDSLFMRGAHGWRQVMMSVPLGP